MPPPQVLFNPRNQGNDTKPDFKSKFVVYAVGAVVQNCLDESGAQREVEKASEKPFVFGKDGKPFGTFSIIKGKLPSEDLSMYYRPHIEAACFTEKEDL